MNYSRGPSVCPNCLSYELIRSCERDNEKRTDEKVAMENLDETVRVDIYRVARQSCKFRPI